MTDLRVATDAQHLFRTAADQFVNLALSSIRDRGRFVVALAGGSTPRGLYTLLASDFQSRVPWTQTFFFWSDERHVPPVDAQSNYRMANEAMLSKVPVPKENVHRIRAENPDAAAAAGEYEQEITREFGLRPGSFPRFDLILLGMGPDGHTASLFPDSLGLHEQQRLVVANWVAKFETNRITFTFPVINSAANVVLLVSGRDKSEMLRNVLEGHTSPPYPVQLVSPKNGQLTWIVDQDAAGLLKGKKSGGSPV